MADKTMLFIYNPYAGKAKIKNHLYDIIDIFTKGGYEVTVYPTQSQGDAVEVTLLKAHKYDLLACAGGDGTLDEVVSAMIKREYRIPIGYIPAGSTNDFAKSLGIPSNMNRAASAIVEGNVFTCDIGKINDDVFVYIAAFGLFTDVSYETDQQMKNVLGHMAYVLEGAKRLNTYPSYHMKVTANGETIEDDFMYGMVTNSISVGGFKNITGKKIKLDDGVFEVTLIKQPKNVVDFNRIMASLVGGNIDTDSMFCFKTDKLILESDQEIAWTTDGEFGGNYQNVVIENKKQELDIIVPIRK